MLSLFSPYHPTISCAPVLARCFSLGVFFIIYNLPSLPRSRPSESQVSSAVFKTIDIHPATIHIGAVITQ